MSLCPLIPRPWASSPWLPGRVRVVIPRCTACAPGTGVPLPGPPCCHCHCHRHSRINIQVPDSSPNFHRLAQLQFVAFEGRCLDCICEVIAEDARGPTEGAAAWADTVHGKELLLLLLVLLLLLLLLFPPRMGLAVVHVLVHAPGIRTGSMAAMAMGVRL